MSKHRSKQRRAEPEAIEPKVAQRESPAAAPAGLFYGRGLWLICAGLFLLVFLVFLPAVKNDFVRYDDQDYVTDNPQVKAGLTAAGVAWAFTTGHASNWHPLTWISHMLDCQVYGLKPWGHHLTSVLFHAANTLLLFILLRRMTGANWRSLIVALLFGLHPLRVESVAWVAERKDVLSTFFWMLTMWSYIFYTERSARPDSKFKVYYVLTLAFFALGLMCKPMLVTLPFVLLLLDWWPLRRISKVEFSVSNLEQRETARFGSVSYKRMLLEKVPFFTLAALSSVITFLVQRGKMSEPVTLAIQLENAVVSYCRYLGKLIWPEGLAVFYPHPGFWPAGAWLGCGLILIILSGVAFALRKSRPWFAVGWCWFLGTLVPVISIVRVGSQSMADRYSYVPIIGILLLVVWSGYELLKRRPAVKLFAIVLFIGGLVVCVGLTERQIGYWRDSYVLFHHAANVTSDNVMALVNVAEIDAQQGRLDEAIADYEKVVRIKPRYAEAMNNLGLLLIRQHRFDEAADVLQSALAVEPISPVYHNNLGRALSAQGRFDEAIVQFQEALQWQPDYARAHQNWGLALAGKRLVDEAIEHFETAVRLDPHEFEARNNLGVAYYTKGRYDDALTQFQAALEIKPNDESTRRNIESIKKTKAAGENHGNTNGSKP